MRAKFVVLKQTHGKALPM